jgi:hypothetical protein
MEGGTVFEFRSYRIRRVAAVVMIVASASAGFILGRLSVLVLPSRPPPERPKTAMSLLPPGAQEPRARAAQKHGAETDVDKGSSSKPPKPIGAPQEHHRIINSASQQPDGVHTPASQPGVNVPESVPQRAEASAYQDCRRRFSSFRESDGTYQPYGGGARMRCPHLP